MSRAGGGGPFREPGVIPPLHVPRQSAPADPSDLAMAYLNALRRQRIAAADLKAAKANVDAANKEVEAAETALKTAVAEEDNS